MDTEKLDIEIKISLMNKFQEFLSTYIYNLTETEFKYIIDTFTIVPQDHKILSLEYFKEFAESK